MDLIEQQGLLRDRRALLAHIHRTIGAAGRHNGWEDLNSQQFKESSVVLFLIGLLPRTNQAMEPCLILNKRSAKVRQSGDLCCPGGGLSWHRDLLFSRFLSMPGFPLARWPLNAATRANRSQFGQAPALLLATGLREAWEEMRLNPLRFTFLGVLPEQHLVMFKRVIYPLVGWTLQQRFKPNWEVDRLIRVPLRRLLDPENYGRFFPMVRSGNGDRSHLLRQEHFPCFIHEDEHGREMLWGATYRITQTFLHIVFDFVPPATGDLPLVERYLDETYLAGSRWRPESARGGGEADW